jgi:hypothetical protein
MMIIKMARMGMTKAEENDWSNCILEGTGYEQTSKT